MMKIEKSIMDFKNIKIFSHSNLNKGYICENVKCYPTLDKKDLTNVFIKIWISPTIVNWL